MGLEEWDLSPWERECKMSGGLPGEGASSIERGALVRFEGMAP